ncbi:MAG: restriction endonuclease, partial [Sphingobacteriales bacterium]
IIDLLAEHGVILENLAEIVGKDYGDFDLICHIAFDQPPLTRKERAENVQKRNYFTKYGEQARAVLNGLLENYADKGVQSIEDAKVLKLKPFSDIGTPLEIIKNVFGGKINYEKAIHELENELFKQEKTA